jgi:HK97 family phage major capsid protein
MIPSNRCLAEAKGLNYLADEFLRNGERSKHAELRKRSEQLLNCGLSSDELEEKYMKGRNANENRAYRRQFERYLSGEIETRDFLVNPPAPASIAYGNLAGGGALVPWDFDGTLRATRNQVDPILDDDVTDFQIVNDPLPASLSGPDLTTITAQLIGDAGQQQPQPIANIAGATLSPLAHKFKATYRGSFESEQDIPGFSEKVAVITMTALARTIGTSVMTGRGGSDILGVTNVMGAPTQTNATPGKVVITDLNTLYFSVNRYSRAAKKCAFLMNDSAYKLVRNATDSSGRPLLSVKDDEEELYGKKVYVSPSLSLASAGVGLVVFGDLSKIVIRMSPLWIQRTIETPGTIEQGEADYIGRVWCDAGVFDPSGTIGKVNSANAALVLASWN